jgi:hypothetical protein
MKLVVDLLEKSKIRSMKTGLIVIPTLILTGAVISFFILRHNTYGNTTDNKQGSTPTASTVPDYDLWKYVYNPSRLKVLAQTKTVTGIIEESNADPDGDQHMLLKLDAGQRDLINARNTKKKQGALVIEAVCVNNVELKKVGKTCKGYVNHIQLPNIGDHVSVTGSYVIDTHNGWAEIHPITQILHIK